MRFRILYEDRLLEDLEAYYEYYAHSHDERKIDLAEESFRAAVIRLSRNPELFALDWNDNGDNSNYRKAPLRGFHLYYRIDFAAGEIVIVAIIHQRRGPASKRARLS